MKYTTCFIKPVYLGIMLLVICSCSSNREVFRQTFSDGTEITGITKITNEEERKYFVVVGRSRDRKTHLEFFIHKFNCDTIVKKVFKGRMVKILILTDSDVSNYPVSTDDKEVFEKAKPFLSSENKCYSAFINRATGYKVYYDGKINSAPFK